MNKIKEAIDILKYYDQQSYFFSNDAPAMNAFKLAISALEQQLKDKWIPVSEGLPPEHKDSQDIFDSDTLAIIDIKHYTVSDSVNVTVKDTELNETFVCDDYTINGKWCTYEDNRFKILAWKQLPEPYKEDK